MVSEGLRADAKKIKRVTEFSFPTSKKGMQSCLGALNYYSRFILDFAVYVAALYQLKGEGFEPDGDLSVARQRFARLQQKIRDARSCVISTDRRSSTLMQEHEGKMHPVHFCRRVLKEADMNYHPAEKEVLPLLLRLKTCYTQLAGRTIHVDTRFSTLEGVHTSKSLFGRTTQFAVILSPWHLIVTRLARAGRTSSMDLEDSLATVTPLTKGSSIVRMDHKLLNARLPRSHSGLVVSFDGSAITEKYDSYGSCSWIVWRLPDWTIVTAARAYLEATTVNMAEYSGKNNGVQAALDIGAIDVGTVGDSRLAIQQSLREIACRKESLMTQLHRHRELVARLKSVKYLHTVREYNASADSLAAEALENKASNVISDEPSLAEMKSVNCIQAIIYAPITVSSTDEPSVSIAQVRDICDTWNRSVDPEPSGNRIEKHSSILDMGNLTVTTRLQAKSKPKRVRFADETSVTGGEDVAPREEANGRQETELSRLTAHNGNTPALPGAEDVDPLTIQRGSRLLRTRVRHSSPRGRINPNVPCSERRKMSDHFVLSEGNGLYYVGTRLLWRDQQQEDGMLRLVVPSTMIQDVLQNYHDSLEGGHQGI
ncbi:LOW QUALITY PROTEIN: hypothetical protein PHMEG_00014076 [Phytophthora megakarya]|uniref:RNase H type-1 domain-containing protein n=1 Tax=Phytophthora megakarya TaxID=4795 RepID=A0A225W569_9STRA|nr:LOW QUALITY PROTEIN: hypothetical protein PHMEG_00014076 [Phytophthora megakarya]